MLVSFVVTPCGRVGSYQRYGGTYCLHFQGSVSPANSGLLSWNRPQTPPPISRIFIVHVHIPILFYASTYITPVFETASWNNIIINVPIMRKIKFKSNPRYGLSCLIMWQFLQIYHYVLKDIFIFWLIYCKTSNLVAPTVAEGGTCDEFKLGGLPGIKLV